MEYVGGGSLAQLLINQTPLPIERILNIALDLSDALVRTHHLNIIHRDLKPANVLLTEDGITKLTDFGVARVQDAQTLVTQVGSILGTVAYLSPELCEGAPYDERGDLWAFGVMLYEMLTGRHPFRQGTTMATIGAILHEPIPDIQPFTTSFRSAGLNAFTCSKISAMEIALPLVLSFTLYSKPT